MADRRRSLLSNTPRPMVRSARPSLKPEDAPHPPSRRPSIPETLPAELPPDPTAVDFDFGLDELPVDALEALDVPALADIEAGSEAVIDGSEEGAPPHVESFDLFGGEDATEEGDAPAPMQAVPQTAQDASNADPVTESGPEPAAKLPPLSSLPTPPTPEAPTFPPVAPRPPAKPPRRSPLAAVPGVFLASMLATMLLALVPWFTLLSPRLHEVREAQRLQQEAALAARLTPPPAPAPVVVVPAPAPPPVEEPEEEEEEEEPEKVEVAAAPKPRPVRRARPRPRPAPEPEPVAAKPPPKPEPAPAPEPEPEPVPDAAQALTGRYAGTSRGEPIVLDLEFLANSRLRATIRRGTSDAMKVTARYSLSGDRATFALVEPVDGGASYSASVSAKGVSGRISHANGKNNRFSLSP